MRIIRRLQHISNAVKVREDLPTPTGNHGKHSSTASISVGLRGATRLFQALTRIFTAFKVSTNVYVSRVVTPTHAIMRIIRARDLVDHIRAYLMRDYMIQKLLTLSYRSGRIASDLPYP